MTTPTFDTEDLARLAELLSQRNEVDRLISRLIGRPAAPGHLGEFIAARVFDLALEASASARAIDGRFMAGPLAGRSVNVKWYAVQQGGLDLVSDDGPDFYLVLTGPRVAAGTSRGALRPLVIASVFLFEAAPLLADLRGRGVKVGVATSVRAQQWAEAMIYPDARNPALAISEVKRALLALYAPSKDD